MRLIFSTAIAATLSITLVSAAPQAPVEQTAAGFWEQYDDDGKTEGWFLIFERTKDVFEGAIVKMFLKPGEDPHALICTKCKGEQKNQPSLGLVIIKDMKRQGRNYEDGTILDPRDGQIWSARMELSPEGKRLLVRGYLGISLFGKSQIWNRLPDNALPLNEVPAHLVQYMPPKSGGAAQGQQPRPAAARPPAVAPAPSQGSGPPQSGQRR
jgi:uncharacterized protein DUF2147